MTAEGLSQEQTRELARLWANLDMRQRPWTYAEWTELLQRLRGHL